MTPSYKSITAAVLTTAAVVALCWLGGCATHRQVEDLRGEVRDIANHEKKTRAVLARIDSTIAAGAEADNRLRSDLAATTDDLQRQIAMLLENYNDLMRQMDQLAQRPVVTKILDSSPGAQPAGPGEQPAGDETPPAQPSVDCLASYDAAFTQQVRGEYEPALAAFEKFLSECPDHENVANAHYWMGVCYYSTDKFVEASEKFQYIIGEFKSSPKYPDANFMLARAKLELGKTQEAKALFQHVADEFPGTFVAEQAKEQLESLK